MSSLTDNQEALAISEMMCDGAPYLALLTLARAVDEELADYLQDAMGESDKLYAIADDALGQFQDMSGNGDDLWPADALGAFLNTLITPARALKIINGILGDSK
jgi:hypothetical protein